jgi:hypothetical protein
MTKIEVAQKWIDRLILGLGLLFAVLWVKDPAGSFEPTICALSLLYSVLNAFRKSRMPLLDILVFSDRITEFPLILAFQIPKSDHAEFVVPLHVKIKSGEETIKQLRITIEYPNRLDVESIEPSIFRAKFSGPPGLKRHSRKLSHTTLAEFYIDIIRAGEDCIISEPLRFSQSQMRQFSAHTDKVPLQEIRITARAENAQQKFRLFHLIAVFGTNLESRNQLYNAVRIARNEILLFAGIEWVVGFQKRIRKNSLWVCKFGEPRASEKVAYFGGSAISVEAYTMLPDRHAA